MTASATGPHWTERWLGFAYDPTGEAPPAMNCWAFFRLVEREQFGRAVPAVPEPDGLFARMKAFRERPDTFGWRAVPLDRARSGDPVLLTCRRQPHHIGVFVDDVARGAVLHCYEGAGSVLHSLFHLELGEWRITAIYRPIGEAP